MQGKKPEYKNSEKMIRARKGGITSNNREERH